MPIRIKRVLPSKLKNILFLLGDPQIEVLQHTDKRFYVHQNNIQYPGTYGWMPIIDWKDGFSRYTYAKPEEALAAWARRLDGRQVRAGRWPFYKYVDLTMRKVVL